MLNFIKGIIDSEKENDLLQLCELFIDYTRDVIFLITIDGRIIGANKTAGVAYGYTHDELLSLTIYDLRHQDTYSLIPEQIDQILKNGALYETIHCRKDGTCFPVEVNAQKTTIRGETILLCMVRDITIRKQTEQNLIKSEEKYRLLYNSINQALVLQEVIFDHEGNPVDCKFIEVNHRFEKLIGLKKGDLLGKTTLEVIPTFDRSLLKRFFEVASTGRPMCLEKHFPEFKKYFELNIYSPRKGQFAVLVADISKRKQMEWDLRRDEALFRGIVENIKDIIFIFNRKQGVTYISPKIAAVFGYELKEMEEQGFASCIHPEDLPVFLERYNDLHSFQQEQKDIDCRLKHKDGTWRWLKIRVSPLEDKNGDIKSFIGVARDVTEEKEIEQELEKINKRLVLADKMAMLSAMGAMVAHEINQPLNALKITIEGLLYFLHKGKTLNFGKLTAKLLFMSEQIERIKKLTQQIVFQAQEMNTPKLAPGDFSDILDKVLDLLHNRITLDGITFKKEISLSGPCVVDGPLKIEVIIINLLNNAIEALDSSKRKDKEIIFKAYLDNSALVFEVSDNGVGIEEKVKNKIFDPLYTTKQGADNMGMGLSTVHFFVKSLKGRIEVSNNLTGGATFRVVLPNLNNANDKGRRLQ